MDKLQAALEYASWGWHVLPVMPNGKIPAISKERGGNGVHDATTDETQIMRWWAENPSYNIGIAAGQKSGIIVFDIDPRNGGEYSWDQFLADNGRDPIRDALLQLTAGGGKHFIAAYDSRVGSTKLDAGIDVLSDGKYFLAYPSEILGNKYQWDDSPFEDSTCDSVPFQIPERWISVLSDRKKVADLSIKTGGAIIEGNRNVGLTSLAGSMRHLGMQQAEILAALQIANETRISPPLPQHELKTIVQSVCRYEAGEDVAAAVAKGKDVADVILANAEKKNRTDYFLTCASNLMGQPSPIPWIVKHHIPAGATGAIYGESGVGKTFAAIDMACSVASGRYWAGIKTKTGIVVYLAGEGNYGLRQRIAAWAQHNQVSKLDNLFVSNKAIDIDSPGANAEILKAIMEACPDQQISMIVIDTLNRHMGGDENSAKDFKTLISACDVVSLSTGATTLFVHHTGHGENARNRMRGSSAMKASLDFMVFVAGDNDRLKVSWEKMKDSRTPDKLCFKFEDVDLGWVDEDGEPEPPAAVIVRIESDGDDEKDERFQNLDPETQRAFHVVQNAWLNNPVTTLIPGHLGNYPLITKEAIRLELEKKSLSERTIANNLTPSRKGSIINRLVEGEIMRQYQNGWIVISELHRSGMFLLKEKDPV